MRRSSTLCTTVAALFFSAMPLASETAAERSSFDHALAANVVVWGLEHPSLYEELSAPISRETMQAIFAATGATGRSFEANGYNIGVIRLGEDEYVLRHLTKKDGQTTGGVDIPVAPLGSTGAFAPFPACATWYGAFPKYEETTVRFDDRPSRQALAETVVYALNTMRLSMRDEEEKKDLVAKVFYYLRADAAVDALRRTQETFFSHLIDEGHLPRDFPLPSGHRTAK